jgi:hypothetical protein
MALGCALFGALWIVQSGRLNYWGEFAPGSGFLPFWLGAAIVVLSLIVLMQSLVEPAAGQAGPIAAGRPGRVVAIVAGLLVCLALLTRVGFVVAIAAYLAFLIGWVERRSLTETVLVSLGASGALWLVFKVWLKVPLPVGPWGF